MVLAGFVLPRTAHANDPTDCSKPEADWVLVTLEAAQGRALGKKVLQHLRAELTVHRISVCSERLLAARPPIATVRVVDSGSQQVGIEVQVSDAVTHKTLARQLDLAGLPADAHAMTIALGVAELLRASWAEINLRSNTETKPVPVSVRHVLEAETKRENAPATLDLRLAGEEFSGRLRQAGADATLGLQLIDPWYIGLRLGVRQALNTAAADGLVRAHTQLAGLGAGVRLTPSGANAHLLTLLRVDVARVQFLAEPNPVATANSGAGTAVMAGLGIMGTIEVSPMVNLLAEADVGSVVKGVRARDAGKDVVAMSGAWLGASTGVSISVW